MKAQACLCTFTSVEIEGDTLEELIEKAKIAAHEAAQAAGGDAGEFIIYDEEFGDELYNEAFRGR